MNDVTLERFGALSPERMRGRLPRAWLPLHLWSPRRRALVAGTAAALTSAAAIGACMANDLVGVQSAEAALGRARHSLADARRALAQLPELRRASALSPPRLPAKAGSVTDDVREVSKLAATSGLAIVSLEPVAAGGSAGGNVDGPTDAARALKLVARGDFTQVRAFLLGLSTSPTLVTPSEISLGRDGNSLSLVATLLVFDALPSVPMTNTDAEDEVRTPLPNPFAGKPGAVAGRSTLRLAGTIRDHADAVALIETPDGTVVVHRGEQLASERVVDIAPPRVTLSAGDVTHDLAFTEDAR